MNTPATATLATSKAMNRRRETRACRWLALCLWIAPSALGDGEPAVPGLPSELLERAALVLAQAERAIEGDPAASLPEPAQVERLIESVEGLLAKDPEHVEGLITKARLGWLGFVVQLPFQDEALTDTVGAARSWIEPLTGALDRAIGLAPERADAHFWRAQLLALGVNTLDGKVVPLLEPTRALESGRRAVELAPADERYRLTLATHLAVLGRWGEAVEVLLPVNGGQSPAATLLADFDRLPSLPGATPLVEEVAIFRQLQVKRGRVLDYASFRVRGYLVPAAAKEVEAAFKARIPGFRWFLRAKQDLVGEPGEIETFAAFLEQKGGALSARKKERGDEHITAGFRIVLNEWRGPLPEFRKQFGMTRPGAFCTLFVANSRPVGQASGRPGK